MKFVFCVTWEGFGELSADDLTLGCLCKIIKPVDSHGMLRVIDDRGEEYLCPAVLFEVVEAHEAMASRLHELLYA